MSLQLYYITDRRQFAGDAREQERRLLEKIRECAAAGVEYVQLREKDLSPRALEQLACKAVTAVRGSGTRLLISSRTDVALACGAHGVQLPGNDLQASDVRAVFAQSGVRAPVIGVSAHSLPDVLSAEAHGADFAVFAPVFEKAGAANAKGLEKLREICRRAHAAMLVFALGGVTLENAPLCVEAGAAGIAGIRLFQENEVSGIVKFLNT
ncbi:MAG TPA: thiamine phosphate synthase [Candidatus Angelobacter sp.]|nr:thiamine phosphate synthase [Candidatus Angelobacter sp.]